MNWDPLTSSNQIDSILEESKSDKKKGVLIFKHSTRCPVSLFAKRNLESDWDIDKEELPTYFLDLIQYRNISNELAEVLQVQHESPQVLLIKDGNCIYNASHSQISTDNIKAKIMQSSLE